MHLAAAAGHEEVLKKLLLVGVEVNDRDSVRANFIRKLNFY